jgi:hypothetical protein
MNSVAHTFIFLVTFVVLQVPDMVFIPSLDNAADSFYDLVDSLVGDMYKQSSLIPRLATHSGQEHYQVREIIEQQDQHQQ